MSDIFAEKSLVKSVMSGRDRSMCREERRSPYNLDCLGKFEILVSNQLAEPFETNERSMSLVAMVNLRIEAELAQGTYSAHAKKKLLLETVLPVSSVEIIGD